MTGAAAAAVLCAVTVFCFFLFLLNKSGGQRKMIRQRVDKIAARDKEQVTRKKRHQKKVQAPKGSAQPKSFEKLAHELAVADIPMRPNEYLLFSLAITMVASGVLYLFTGALGAIVGAVLGGAAMPIWLQRKKKKRMKLFENQLSDALTVISNCLQAGFSFQQALESIASDMPDPIAKEFSIALRESRLGLPLEKALVNMSERLQQDDLELLINAVLIQKQVGGNLSEILDSIGGTIRERLKIRGQIKTLTASGRMSGIVIGLLPLFILAFLMVINPGYVQLFFQSAVGIGMLVAAVCLEVIGFLVVRKVVDIKF